jgi:hypothetical protein
MAGSHPRVGKKQASIFGGGLAGVTFLAAILPGFASM